MRFWGSENNLVTVALTGAELCKTLSEISTQNIKLYNVSWKSELDILLQCSPRDVLKIQQISESKGDSLKILKHTGTAHTLDRCRNRYVLMTGCIILILLTVFVPTRIFFFQVEGNERISARQILAAAENCGIRFGITRRELRSEKMKNALLSAMPELKWAGINTFGCTAVISVREREIGESQTPQKYVSNVISARDGYVTSCIVTKGRAVCKPGEIVRAGQLLISGYNDCGICVQVTGAEGEICANTERAFEAVMPSVCMSRTVIKDEIKYVSFIAGKKRIKLWKDSGIWDTTCGRIYEEYYITLPGGFRLPFCIAIESITKWECKETEYTRDMIDDDIRKFAQTSVLRQMVSGSILSQEHDIVYDNESFILSSDFLCSEMIGRTITEENGEFNGKAN